MFLCSLCVLVIILNFMCCIGLCSNCFSYWVAHKQIICSLGTTRRTTFTIHCVHSFAFEPYLPLPAQPKTILIFRPRSPAEFTTVNKWRIQTVSKRDQSPAARPTIQLVTQSLQHWSAWIYSRGALCNGSDRRSPTFLVDRLVQSTAGQ